MYLEKLEIQGFKSFAHKIILEFDQGITAIVGPNGSGKSNIADAVRWVLGEQSLKLLRGKKSRDVIFSGSGKKARLGMAEVSIFINNKNGQTPIDYSELVITRRIYQNGEGEYFVNRQQVRLQDIHLLLAKANFGQKNYSVIGQGMIDSVLVASPEVRKEFFDDAAGVRGHQIKKDQAQLKLSHTQENLAQAEMLIQEIAPRLRSLTRQVRRLERREKIEKDLESLQKTHYCLLWQDLDKKYTEGNKKYEAENAQLKKGELKREEIQAKINLIAEADTGTQIFQKYQREYQLYQQEKNKLLQEQAVLKGKTELEYFQKGRSDVAWLEKRKSELEQSQDNLQKEIDLLQVKQVREKYILAREGQEQEQIINKLTQLEKALEESLKNLQHKPELDLAHLLDFVEKIYQEQKNFWEKLDKIQALEEIYQLREEASNLTKKIEDLRNQLQNIKTHEDVRNLPILQKKFSELSKTKDSLGNEINNRKVQLESREEKLRLLAKEILRIKEERQKMENELIQATTAQDIATLKKAVAKENEVTEKKLKEVESKIIKIQQKLSSFGKEEEGKKDELLTLQREMQKLQQESNERTNKTNMESVELAKIATKREDLEKEIKENLGNDKLQELRENKIAPDSVLKEISYFERENQLKRLKQQLELIGGIDPAIQEEYHGTFERHQFLTTQVNDLKEASHSLEKVIEELEEKIKKQFNDAFKKINDEFGKYFKLLFNGGKATLALRKEEPVTNNEEESNEEEIVEEKQEEDREKKKVTPLRIKLDKIITGIDIQACPPGKKLSDLNMLSGGEKALTSIALICAIISSNPPPFTIFDEVDAALDESNSIKFAQILEKLSHHTQFVTITHNRATMHQAAILYGVTMSDDGVSKLLSVKMEEAEKIRNENKS